MDVSTVQCSIAHLALLLNALPEAVEKLTDQTLEDTVPTRQRGKQVAEAMQDCFAKIFLNEHSLEGSTKTDMPPVKGVPLHAVASEGCEWCKVLTVQKHMLKPVAARLSSTWYQVTLFMNNLSQNNIRKTLAALLLFWAKLFGSHPVCDYTLQITDVGVALRRDSNVFF